MIGINAEFLNSWCYSYVVKRTLLPYIFKRMLLLFADTRCIPILLMQPDALFIKLPESNVKMRRYVYVC